MFAAKFAKDRRNRSSGSQKSVKNRPSSTKILLVAIVSITLISFSIYTSIDDITAKDPPGLQMVLYNNKTN